MLLLWDASALVKRYALERGTEAAIGSRCALIAADQRFLHAAQREGLDTLNPELHLAVDIPPWLASLGHAP